MSGKMVGVVCGLAVVALVLSAVGYLILHQPTIDNGHILQEVQGLIRANAPPDTTIRFAPIEETTIKPAGDGIWDVSGSMAMIDADGVLKKYNYFCRVGSGAKGELGLISSSVDRLY